MSTGTVRTIATHGWRIGCAVALAASLLSTEVADARNHHHRIIAKHRIAKHRAAHHHRIGHGIAPPFSHIVMDANSGRVIEALKPDELRHPASLTKIMTLYLLFEQLEAGNLKLRSPLPISSHAASRPPTKLGLVPGHTLAVEDAIKGMVTRSANDAAVVVGEAIGGSEQAFAEMMTRKAHALGMTHTVYYNASGLPDDRQVTTARDQAILGRAIERRFPRYYKYFSTNAFYFRGRPIYNHNHLLHEVAGVDGIKTGYTRASGYNLVTSVKRSGRHIVAVVLGGRSSRSRDAFMRGLIHANFARAETGHVAPLTLASADGVKVTVPLPPVRLASAAGADIGAAAAVPANGFASEDAAAAAQVPSANRARPADWQEHVARRANLTLAEAGPPVLGAMVGAAAGAPSISVVATAVTDRLAVYPAWFPYALIVIGSLAGLASAVWLVFGDRLTRLWDAVEE